MTRREIASANSVIRRKDRSPRAVILTRPPRGRSAVWAERGDENEARFRAAERR